MSEPGQDLTTRMVGAAFLNIDTFEEVEHDQDATTQAAAIVMMVAACKAIGAVGGGVSLAMMAGVTALISWLVWAGVTYLVGEKIFQGKATWGELLRTLGFAQAPGVLYLFGIVPLVGAWVSGVVSLWILVAGFVAIRQALDIGNFKTFLTILVGGGVYTFLQLFLFFL